MASDPPSFSRTERRAGWRGIAVLTLLAFVAGLGVAIALVRYYAAWTAPAGQTAGSGSAAGGVASMFVPPPEADTGARSPDAAALDARLTALSTRLAAMEARAVVIDRDSQSAAGNAGRAEALMIAFAARRAIDQGQPLGYLESQLRARFGQSQPRATAAIIDASRNPVTIEDLRLGLDTIAPQLTTGGTSAGWWPSLHREILGLIVIRKEGTPSPRPADRLARVKRMLDGRQVEAALAEVERLPGAAQAGAWTGAASRFIDVHRALDLIEGVALAGPMMVDSGAMSLPRAPARPAAAPPSPAPTTAITRAP